jgi:transcriptional regulator with XRE-family HTH domain
VSENEKFGTRSFGDRLRALRAYAGLSRADLESQYGIPETSLKSWETDPDKEITKKSIQRLVEVFMGLGIYCTPQWLSVGLGPSPFSPISFESTDSSESSEDTAKTNFKNTYPAHIHHRIDTSDLQPHFFEDDLVAGCQIDPSELPYKLGVFCLFQMQDHKIIAGRLVNGSTPEKFSIIQDVFFQTDQAVIVDAKIINVYEILAMIREPW